MKNNRLIQVLCLIFGIFLLTCFSESHAEASDAGIHDHSHEGVYGEWLPWESSSSLPTGGGNYYLTKNVVLDGYSEMEYLEVWGNLNLCLNGHTITQTYEKPAINVGMNCKLGIYDNESNSGTIRHGYFRMLESPGQTYTYFAHGAAVKVSSYGQFNMYGGRIKGNTLGVSVSGTSAIFNMHGGIIEENTDYQDGPGGGIEILNGGTFNLHNGLIQENAGSNGSGVDVENGTFNMYGGIIRNNRISPRYESTVGGGVYVSSNGEFNLMGGKITGNEATYGGGVYSAFSRNGYGAIVSQAVIRISGSPVIQNNQGSNVFIPTISPIEIKDQLENAKIGITIYSVESNKETVAGVFTNGLDGKGELSNFYSDQDSFRININNAGEAQLEEKVYVNRLVTFKVVNGAWNDGSTDDRQISFYGDELESFYLASNQIPGVGSNPNPGYTVGTWDVQPSTSTPIREDITYTYTYENPFLFTTDGDSVVITGYSGEVHSTLLIPSELEGKAVKRIGSSAFDQCVGLTQVVISDGITDIGSSAFAHCTDLESIELPPSIKRIGYGAFFLCSSLRNIEISDLTAWCNIKYGNVHTFSPLYVSYSLTLNGEPLTELDIPEGIENISDYSFLCCNSITKVRIPAGVTSIGEYAFQSCRSLRSVEIPDSVSSIQTSSFLYTDSLAAFSVDSSNPVFSVIDGALCNKTGTEIICFPKTYSGEYSIPSTVTTIRANAFCSCSNLTRITIPSTVTSIGYGAFYLCPQLKSAGPVGGNYDIQFAWAERIPDEAFAGCDNLSSITFPIGITEIGTYACSECYSLTDVTFQWTIQSVQEQAFMECPSLQHLYYTGTGEEWLAVNIDGTGGGNNALFDAELIYLAPDPENASVLPISLNRIDESAFEACSFTSVIIPSEVTEIGNMAFASCRGLEYIFIPPETTVIADDAFQDDLLLTILGAPGSYAQTYAVRNGIHFREA